MKHAMSRREFFAAVLPSPVAVRKTGRSLQWAFYLLCCYLAFRLFAGVRLEGWQELGWLALKCLVLAVGLLVSTVWIARVFERHLTPRLRGVRRSAGSGFTAVSLMALGALLHDLWLRHPAEAVVGVVVLALMAMARWFDSRRDQKLPD